MKAPLSFTLSLYKDLQRETQPLQERTSEILRSTLLAVRFFFSEGIFSLVCSFLLFFRHFFTSSCGQHQPRSSLDKSGLHGMIFTVVLKRLHHRTGHLHQFCSNFAHRVRRPSSWSLLIGDWHNNKRLQTPDPSPECRSKIPSYVWHLRKNYSGGDQAPSSGVPSSSNSAGCLKHNRLRPQATPRFLEHYIFVS